MEVERRLLRARKRPVARVTSRKEFAQRTMPKRAKSEGAREVPFQFSSAKADKSAPFQYEKKQPAATVAPPAPKVLHIDADDSEPRNVSAAEAEEAEEKAEFETTLARVAKLSQGMLRAADQAAGDPARRFRAELRQGLGSLDAALGRQREALERLRGNAADAGRFRSNNAAMQRRAEQAERGVSRKQEQLAEARRESEVLGWASQQLEKLEQLTPRLEKAAAGRGKTPAAAPAELRGVVDASQSKEQLLARLEELSARIKRVVDQL